MEIKPAASYAEPRARGPIVVEAEAAAYHAENFAQHAAAMTGARGA